MARPFIFSRNQYYRIKRAAAEAVIHELCYLVFGRERQVVRVIRVPNRASDTVMHHVFGSEDFDRVQSWPSLKKLSFLGFLHTHILSDAVPSLGDIAGYPQKTVIFIYSADTESLRSFEIVGGKIGYIERAILLR